MSGAAQIRNPSPSVIDDRSLFQRLRYTPLIDLLRGRITGRLHIVHDIEKARLPGPLPMLVKNVVQRTRLWRTEKADVARELIAHFRDGLDSGASPVELAGMFGDPNQAAKLIRRAKKRNRPLVWRTMRNAVRGTAATVGLIVFVYLVLTARFLIGRPNPTIDYRPQLNAAALAVADADRAWPVYREALMQLGNLPEEPTQSNGNVWTRPARPGEEGWDLYDDFLQQHQAALVKAREAAAKPGLGFIADYGVTPEDQKLWPGSTLNTEADQDDGLYSILLPYLSSMRTLGLALQLDALRAAAAGDGAAVTADITAMLGIARHSRETSLIINDLVSLAVFNLATATLNDVLSNHPDCLDNGQIRYLAHRLGAWDDLMLRVRLDGERLGFSDILQRIYTDDGHGDGRMTLAGLRKLALFQAITASPDLGLGKDPIDVVAAPALCEVMLGRKAMSAEFDRLINLAQAEAARPMWEHDRDRFDEEIEAIGNSPIECYRKKLVFMLVPAIGKAWQNSERTILGRDATLVALALTLYHRQHNAWPNSLNELTPALLPAVPLDRFDGLPLKFVLRDGHPVVYAVGVDRKDDGGRAPAPGTDPSNGVVRQWRPRQPLETLPDGDWILWPKPVEPRYKYNVYPD